MAVKAFFASKLNWLGIIEVLIGSLDLIASQNPSTTISWILVFKGVLTIVLRTFFTATRVQIGGEK